MIAGISETERQVVRDMMSDLIMGTDGIDILRKRVDTSHKPASFDEDFGEVIDQGEVWYLDLNLRGKVFWGISQKALYSLFGGSTTAECEIHFPYGSDIKNRDFLIIDERTLKVIKIIERDSYLEVYAELSSLPIPAGPLS